MRGAGVASRIGPHDRHLHREDAGGWGWPSPLAGLRPGHEGTTAMIEDLDMNAMALRRKQAAEDQVRVAYGAVPVILAGLPIDHPVRTAIRDRARSLLVERGYLTPEELGALPVKDAIAAALRRFRGEIGRMDPGVGRAARSGRKSIVVAPRGTGAHLGDQPVPV